MNNSYNFLTDIEEYRKDIEQYKIDIDYNLMNKEDIKIDIDIELLNKMLEEYYYNVDNNIID